MSADEASPATAARRPRAVHERWKALVRLQLLVIALAVAGVVVAWVVGFSGTLYAHG